MTKITRNSYKRKIIIGGVLLFMLIALVSTGFAAWVISKDASKPVDGNVVVGTVEDGSVELSDVVVKDNKTFIFDCRAEDTEGRVTFRGTDTELGETLSITITGKVKPLASVESITVKLDVPESVKKAAEQNYIVLPECATEAVSIDIANLTAEADGWYSFEYEIKFAWGSAFNEKNPGDYYDVDQVELAFETVQSEMDTFRETLYGTEAEDHLKYTVTVTAHAKK